MVNMERLEYHKNRDRAILDLSQYYLIILDGADQSAFGLPQFRKLLKPQRRHTLKVKVMGPVDHYMHMESNLLTMTRNHATGAIHTVETVHRSWNARRLRGHLPKRLFVQVASCSRENKIKYVMPVLEYLVPFRVFDTVEVGLLANAHTD